MVTVDLPRFDASSDIVELDVKTLLAGSDVTVNTEKTALGCMSGQTDPECGPLFERLGLAFGTSKPMAQSVFRAVPATAATH